MRPQPKLFYRPLFILFLIPPLICIFYLAWPLLRPGSSAASTAPPLTARQFQAEKTKLTQHMRRDGMAATFAYVAQRINTNASFARSCHPLLHELGHEAFTYFGSYAKAIVYQKELCDAGYMHGVLESYLTATPDIKQALRTACQPAVETFALWQCFHGLGHGIMMVSLANIPRSLQLCQTLPTTFAQDACSNGVAMQHFVVTHHDGTVPRTNPTSLADCTLQNRTYQRDCYGYAPSAYLTINAGQYTAALMWCKQAQAGYLAACVAGVGSQAMKDHITSPTLVMDICKGADRQYTDPCMNGAVSMYAFFYASSAAAEELCSTVFHGYEGVCQAAVSTAKKSFKI